MMYTLFFVVSVAYSVASQGLNQSPLFNLVVLSANSTINGSVLEACHEGAAIEALCLGPKFDAYEDFSEYNFNVSATDAGAATTPNTFGVITWSLHVSSFNVSEALRLAYNPISNIAIPIFFPDHDGTYVQFDECNKLNIQGYADDRLPPDEANTATEDERYYRWYICTTDYAYVYQTLAWVMGEYPPQNPTCVKVDVIRVFV